MVDKNIYLPATMRQQKEDTMSQDKQIHIRIPEELVLKLKQMASQEKRTLNNLVHIILDKAAKKEKVC